MNISNEERIINDLVWWIPFKKLRNDIRDLLISMASTEKSKLLNEIKHLKSIIERMNIDKEYIYKTIINNQYFEFYDLISSKTVFYVSGELNGDCYNIESMNFDKGDVVIDIGGNIGMTSIYLAKKFPYLKIYSFEPVKENYEHFIKNIKLNNIENDIITVENKAVTKDARDVVMLTNLDNVGFSRISDYYKEYAKYSNIINKAESITLENIFDKYNINKCKLLKIDCEGSEYEILLNTKENILKRIEFLSGEFHKNQDTDVNHNQDSLFNYLTKFITNVHYH